LRVTKDGKPRRRCCTAQERHPRQRARARACCRASSRIGKLRLDLSRSDGADGDARSRCWSIGSGAIGIEFASRSIATLGAEVTVVEMMDRILPVEDDEISCLRPARRSRSRG
jgi:NADPH-dependent 2,4-dienoyl-CoA reductase/sulfur reductase-like enzyme